MGNSDTSFSKTEDRYFVLPQDTFIRVCGRNFEHIKLIEAEYGVKLVTRGNEIRIAKNGSHPNRAYRVLEDLVSLAHSRKELTLQDVKYIIRMVRDEIRAENINTRNGKDKEESHPSETATISEQLIEDYIRVPAKRGRVVPKTINQKHYIDSVRNNDIVFGIGPAGTGKTYLAMALAVEYLVSEKVGRIVLVRPAVEAGEKLGFLPGDIEEKVNPYLRPLYDALYDMMDPHRVRGYMQEGFIEVAPLAFMRGRTLNDSFIILDEAQNTTPEQMKMFLTRLGFDSKAVITGDITQIDLPSGRESGLIQAMKILNDVQGIQFVHFTGEDVVRHELVQEIIKAYAIFTEQQHSGLESWKKTNTTL